jgi:hypothetical protein
MLRITANGDGVIATLKLEGRVVGDWIPECLKAWQSLIPVIKNKPLCVDLRGVTFVDRNGKQLLAEIYRKHHPQFLANTPLTKQFAADAVAQGDAANAA